jgi:hypoxanthine phosphoribosyltransferase
MNEPFRCELISWATVVRLSRELADTIIASSFRPDLVIAIARGGYVPARLLCDYLALSDLCSIRIVHYTAGANKQPQAQLVDGIGRDLTDSRVLLVDDVNDTGDTLEIAQAHAAEQGAFSIRIGVLHHKQISTVQPDYCASRLRKWRWIVYPWAVTEDVTGFIEQLPNRPGDEHEAAAMLQHRYGLTISPSLLQDIWRRRRQYFAAGGS